MPLDDNSTKPFTFSSQQEATEFIANTVSTLLKADRKATKKEIIDETIKEMNKGLTDFGTKLEGKFGELNLALQNKRDKKGAKAGEGGEGGGDEDPVNPHTRTLEKRILELENTNKAERERANQAEAKRRMMTVRSRLREVLEANGVTNAHKVKGAMAILIDQEKRVDFSESFDDAAVIDTDGAPIDLEQGVRTWLATEEGEYYKDPSGAGGAGSRPGKRNGAADQPRPLTKAEIGQAMLNSWNRSGG